MSAAHALPQSTGGPPKDPKQVALQTISTILEKKKAEIARAVPQHLNPDKLIRIAMTSIQGDGKLLACDPISLYTSVIQAAQVGLVPDGFLGESYLVPFNVKVGDKHVLQAKLLIGYRGLIKLALQTDKVSSVNANVVFEADVFEHEEGLLRKLVHKPTRFMSKRGPVVAAYAIAALKHIPREEWPFRVMYFDEIERIRRGSQNGADAKGDPIGPWKSHWEEMARKTVIRALAKYLNLSPELTQAAVIDEYNESGIEIGSGPIIDVAPSTPGVPVVDGAAADLRTKIIDQKNGTEKKTETQAIEWGEDAGTHQLLVSGLVTKVFTPKAGAKVQKLDVYLQGENEVRLGCFDQPLWEHILPGRGKVCIFIYEKSKDEKYYNITGLRKIGNTEFDNGVPVMTSDEAAEYSKNKTLAQGGGRDVTPFNQEPQPRSVDERKTDARDFELS